MTMKLLFTTLLCLLLAGCSATPGTSPAETTPAPREIADSLRQCYGSTVEAVSLPFPDVQQILPFGSGFLLCREHTLTLLDEQFQPTASTTLDFLPEVTVAGELVSAFDPHSRQMLLLDVSLTEIRRLTLPEALSGSPVISENSLYYCTDSGLYLWDLQSGIRRRIRESAYDAQFLIGLHWSGTVLQCRIRDGKTERDLFLDAHTGQLLQELNVTARLNTVGHRYYCIFSAGFVENRLFGDSPESPRGLFPEESFTECIFLPENHSAVTVTDSLLTYYDLETGRIRDTLLLHHQPMAIVEGQNCILLLVHEQEHNILLKWNLTDVPKNGKNHTDSYFTAENPDHAGLSLCRNYARTLSEQFGLEILIGKEAAAVTPWDYSFTPEHRYPVLLSQLQTLEKCLSRYPKEILTETAAHFDSLNICLVQSITGTAGDTSLSTATGIQFLDGSNAHIVLAAGEFMEQALHHEFFHVMETHIFSHSSALDRWDELNPAGFSYDLDHSANATRNSGVYLDKETRAFVDTYSMSFPREDRARIFEYAVLADSAHLFSSGTMQEKLRVICSGIREAYDLTKSQEIFPWEQYLR